MVTVASCGAGALRRPVRSAPLRRAPTGLAAHAAVPEGPAAAQPTRRSTRRRDWLLGIGCTLTAAPRGASAGVDVGGLLEAQRDRDYEKLAEGCAPARARAALVPPRRRLLLLLLLLLLTKLAKLAEGITVLVRVAAAHLRAALREEAWWVPG